MPPITSKNKSSIICDQILLFLPKLPPFRSFNYNCHDHDSLTNFSRKNRGLSLKTVNLERRCQRSAMMRQSTEILYYVSMWNNAANISCYFLFPNIGNLGSRERRRPYKCQGSWKEIKAGLGAQLMLLFVPDVRRCWCLPFACSCFVLWYEIPAHEVTRKRIEVMREHRFVIIHCQL